jgi:hypothetical protein
LTAVVCVAWGRVILAFPTKARRAIWSIIVGQVEHSAFA